MPIPFLSSIGLNKNEVQDFKVFNLASDPTLTNGGDYGYFWLNTSGTKTLKFWDGANIRSLIDSTTISTSTAGTANDLSGGVAGSLPYQQGVGDTTFLGIGSSGYILTSTGSAPQWSASIPSSSVSGLAASATTDTTNASNISSGTLGLARLSLASGQFYVGDGSNNPAATAKSSIPLSGFGNAAADINIGGFKITNSGTIGSGDADSTVATKGYVDSVAQGLDVKASCLVATTADITLASPGAVTIDGIYSATDFTAGTTRILVKDQSAAAENGIYIWQGPSSAMTRSADANTWDELVGAFTFVERGTANADSGWVCTVNAGGTLGTTAVTFVKFSQAGSYTPGNGIVQSGTSFNFAQSAAYTAGQIPFAGGTLGTSSTTIGFDSNFVWDDQANRLGIGTPTPGYPLSVNGRISYNGAIGEGPDTTLSSSGTTLLHGNSSTWVDQQFYAGGFVQYRLQTSGVFTWYDGAGGTRMTLNGTGLGVGVSPAFRLDVKTSTDGNHIRVSGAGQNAITFGNNTSTAGQGFLLGRSVSSDNANNFFLYDLTSGNTRMLVDSSGNLIRGATAADTTSTDSATMVNIGNFAVQNAASSGTFLAVKPGAANGTVDICADARSGNYPNLRFFTSSTTQMTLTAGGNLGLGVTPSAWGYAGVYQTLYGSLFGLGNSLYLGNNWRYAVGTSYKLAAGYAHLFEQNRQLGTSTWYTSSAGAGAAGDTITFNPQMTLDASGRLLLGAVSVPDTGLSFYNSNGTVGLGHYLTSTVAYVGTWTNHALALASNGTERLRIKTTGQVNFVGLASDPAGAAGDVYYNSGSNVFKVYDTGWKTLPRKYVVQLSDGSVTVAGNAYTITHNLGSQDVTVSIRRTTDNAVVQADVVMPAGGNTVTVTFAAAITASQFYVTVIG